MSDIFISYARADQSWVERLSASLEKSGWSVWWDRRLQAGDLFDDVIRRQIDGASTVLVLWSSQSVNSLWVKAEAAAAQEHNKLVPVRIDAAPVPLPFSVFHTIDLRGWNGSESDPNLLALFRALAERPAGSRRASPGSDTAMPDAGWHAVLLVKEPTRRRFLLQNGTRRHELECRFRPNYLWNRFVVAVDGADVRRGGHQYRDSMSFDFPLGDDWVGQVRLASGDTASTGEMIGSCQVSIGGRVLYREPENG